MKVKQLLNKPSKWCKGSFAMKKDGLACGSLDLLAVKFCLLGAVKRCYSEDKWVDIIDKIRGELGYRHIINWNNAKETTFSDVKKLVNKLDI